MSAVKPFVPEPLKEIARQVERGERPSVTVRTLLSWFWGSQRRGQFIVFAIRAALEELVLQTVPDFNLTYIDAQVEFEPAAADPQSVSTPLSQLAGINLQATD